MVCIVEQFIRWMSTITYFLVKHELNLYRRPSQQQQFGLGCILISMIHFYYNATMKGAQHNGLLYFSKLLI